MNILGGRKFLIHITALIGMFLMIAFNKITPEVGVPVIVGVLNTYQIVNSLAKAHDIQAEQNKKVEEGGN